MERGIVAWALTCLVAGCAPWASSLPSDPARGRVVPASLEPVPATELESAAAEPDGPALAIPDPEIQRADAEEALPAAPRDDAVERAGAELGPEDPAPRDELAQLVASPGQVATEIAAQVGDTYISTREVKLMLLERVRGNEAWSQMPIDQKKLVVADILRYLINRALVVQAARQQLSKPKQWEALKERIEETWQSNELPGYLKRFRVHNEVELAHKLAQMGQSLDDVKQSYHLDQISKMYTYEKIHNKIHTPEVTEIYTYYRENLAKFQRPAEITWREIFFSIDGEHPRDAARGEAAAAAARIAAGESFASVARATSRGATAADGGLWRLAPGSFGSAVVNEALGRLQIGEISGVLEDGRGVYLVVVEGRRPAGTIPFDDRGLQRRIREELQQSQYEKAIDEFLEGLRKRILVRAPMLDSLDHK